MATTSDGWRTSSHSGANGGQCVEIAFLSEGAVAICDSKNPTGPALMVAPDMWDAFIARVCDGEFDAQALAA